MKFKYLPLFIIHVSLFFVVISKANYIDDWTYNYTTVQNFGFLNTLLNDGVIYALIIVLFGLSTFQKISRRIAISLRLLPLSLLTIYLLDFYSIVNFSTRLTYSDLFKYGNYGAQYLSQTATNVEVKQILIFIASTSSILICWITKPNYNTNVITSFCLLPAALVILISITYKPSGKYYFHSWIYQNVFDYNRVIRSKSRPYSKDFVKNFTYEEILSCENVPANQPNIILLMVESLSSYQSNHFSGIKNWTPNLDRIAKQHSSYLNFYANSYNTADAQAALLTGIPPIKGSKASQIKPNNLGKHPILEKNLPTILNDQGYYTAYMTTGDLSFAGTQSFATDMGFTHIEGHEHPYYNSWYRTKFNAAPDEALYLRVTNKIQAIPKKPYFMFIATLSTHHPYQHPETGVYSEAQTFKYADLHLGKLYDQLSETGFFEDGVLIILGDHHAMTPLKKEEIQQFSSKRAAAKIPLVIATNRLNKYVSTSPFQQIDIYNSIRGLITGNKCHSSWIGDIIEDKRPTFIFHKRGDRRNLVDVFFGPNNMEVLLNGDKTQIINSKSDSIRAEQDVVNKINAIRIINSEY